MKSASNACDIAPRVRQIVLERDNKQCVICGQGYLLELAHYVPRSQLGLGIPENIVVLCKRCHMNYDNGDKREDYGNLIRDYLKGIYPSWKKKDVIYNKYRWLDEDKGKAKD